MRAALLLLVLAATPQLSREELRALPPALPAFAGPLAPLGPLLVRARAGSAASVATVRDRLKALRELEAAARPVLAGPLSAEQRAAVHLTLGLAWAELADLEMALALEGEGEGAMRDAVRGQAQSRAQDALALTASELFACAREPGLPAGLAKACAPGLRLGGTRRQGGPAAEVATSRAEELQACWQEHLLAQGAEEPLALTATLDLEPERGGKRVSAVELSPAPTPARAHLYACLSTRLLAWRVSDDAEALELPLRLGR